MDFENWLSFIILNRQQITVLLNFKLEDGLELYESEFLIYLFDRPFYNYLTQSSLRNKYFVEHVDLFAIIFRLEIQLMGI